MQIVLKLTDAAVKRIDGASFDVTDLRVGQYTLYSGEDYQIVSVDGVNVRELAIRKEIADHEAAIVELRQKLSEEAVVTDDSAPTAGWPRTVA